MNTTGSTKEGTKDTSLPRSTATPKDNQKKERLFPWELATVTRALAAISVQPYFQGATMAVAKPSSQTAKWDKQKAKAVLGREKVDNQCFFLPFWILKKGDDVKFLPSSLSQARKRFRWANFGKNSYRLPTSASFLRMPSAGSRVSGVSHWVSS